MVSQVSLAHAADHGGVVPSEFDDVRDMLGDDKKVEARLMDAISICDISA